MPSLGESEDDGVGLPMSSVQCSRVSQSSASGREKGQLLAQRRRVCGVTTPSHGLSTFITIRHDACTRPSSMQSVGCKLQLLCIDQHITYLAVSSTFRFHCGPSHHDGTTTQHSLPLYGQLVQKPDGRSLVSSICIEPQSHPAHLSPTHPVSLPLCPLYPPQDS